MSATKDRGRGCHHSRGHWVRRSQGTTGRGPEADPECSKQSLSCTPVLLPTCSWGQWALLTGGGWMRHGEARSKVPPSVKTTHSFRAQPRRWLSPLPSNHRQHLKPTGVLWLTQERVGSIGMHLPVCDGNNMEPEEASRTPRTLNHEMEDRISHSLVKGTGSHPPGSAWGLPRGWSAVALCPRPRPRGAAQHQGKGGPSETQDGLAPPAG